MPLRVLVLIVSGDGDGDGDAAKDTTADDLVVYRIGGDDADALTRHLAPDDLGIGATTSRPPLTSVLPRATGPKRKLTGREREVLGYIASGLTHSQTATRMQLAKATVDTYVERIRRKLGAGNKADLTRAAVLLDLFDDHAE